MKSTSLNFEFKYRELQYNMDYVEQNISLNALCEPPEASPTLSSPHSRQMLVLKGPS